MPIIEGSSRRPYSFTGAGAPPANHLAGTVKVGSLLVNEQTGVLYICTVTNGTNAATWVSVGGQT